MCLGLLVAAAGAAAADVVVGDDRITVTLEDQRVEFPLPADVNDELPPSLTGEDDSDGLIDCDALSQCTVEPQPELVEEEQPPEEEQPQGEEPVVDAPIIGPFYFPPDEPQTADPVDPTNEEEAPNGDTPAADPPATDPPAADPPAADPPLDDPPDRPRLAGDPPRTVSHPLVRPADVLRHQGRGTSPASRRPAVDGPAPAGVPGDIDPQPAEPVEPGEPSADDDEVASGTGLGAGRGSRGGTGAALPVLQVTTTGGHTSGPRGSLLRIVARDHGACDTVYFFLGDRRIASGRSGPDGTVVVDGVSAPGATEPGRRPLTTSCSSAGQPVVASAQFVVTDRSLHRSSFVTSLVRPDQVLLDPSSLAVSVALVLLFLVLVAWPADLFNSTLEENYAEVRGWFRRGSGDPWRPATRARSIAVYAAFTAVLAVLYGLIEPGYGLDRSSVALTIGLMIGLTAVVGAIALPEVLHGRRLGHRGHLRVLPATLAVAAGCVAISRAVGFEPGYLYGGLAAVVFAVDLREETEGRLAAASAGAALLLGAVAWVAWSSVSVWAGEPDAGFVLLTVEATLAATFATAVETGAFMMLPMRFMAGGAVMGWSRRVWSVIFGAGMLFFVHVIVRPNAGYVSPGSGTAMTLVVVGVVAFALGSLSFWAYFRYRPQRDGGGSPGDEVEVALTPSS